MVELLFVAADVSGLSGIQEVALLLQLGLPIHFQVNAPLQNRVPEHRITLFLQHLLNRPVSVVGQ